MVKRSQPNHEQHLRRAFDVARQARARGDHPVGATLVGPDGVVLREQGADISSEGRDMTAHAERLLATWASKNYSLEFLTDCTLYSSAEPLRHVRGRDLLERHRMRRLWADRAQLKIADQQPYESDTGCPLPRNFRQGPAAH